MKYLMVVGLAPALALAVAFAGCERPAAPTQFSAPVLRAPSFASDTRPQTASPLRQKAGATATTILFLNFDGGVLDSGADYAPGNLSEIAGTTVPAFAPPAMAKYTRQQGIDAVTDRLRTFYNPFNIQITTTRPASGDYTMVMIGGSHTIVPGASGAAGVSLLDCDNSNADNVAFDFSDDLTPDFGGIPEIAVDAAHESGHSFGLEHTDNPLDIMYSVSNPMSSIGDIFNSRFTTGNYSSYNANGTVASRCPSRGTALDNAALLTTALGANPNPGDTQPPTVNWTFPMLPQVPPVFVVNFTATDNTQVERLELYKNAELIAVMTQSPYQVSVSAASGESFYLTVEAIDTNANRTTVTRTFIADSATPPLCPNGNCAGGDTCKQGICRAPIGTACTVSTQCENDCKMPTGVTANICTQPCSNVKPCPTGFDCAADLLCAPMTAPPPKANGETCAAPAECLSGRCQGECVAACENGTGCDPGFNCIVVNGGEGCAPAPSPMPKASNGCELAPGAAPMPLAFAFVFAFAFAFVFRGWSGRRRAG